MQMKKSKAFLAAFLAVASTCAAIVPTVASAGQCVNKAIGDDPDGRTKAEAYGDETYAQRFMSLYDDVITNGVENGYMSSTSTVSGGLGVPYHSAEELCIEAPDYGHETTSEAMSYLVWVASMRDHIVNAAKSGEATVKGTKDAASEEVGDLAKAWKTMEATLVPDAQGRMMTMGDQLSATYSDEWEQVELYPTGMDESVKGNNPIHSLFCNAYGNDGGLYLMNWLADVDDWYGFGAGTSSQYKQKSVSGDFTMINTFQRGEQESCWETIPHASVEELKYGVPGNGMKAFFNTEDKVAAQFAYTNAPDAEDRAIQAVYAANRWGVGNQNVDSKWGGSQTVSALAGKMGDECRNNMYDKYYVQIGAQNKNAGGGSDNGKHYLMNWYTSWGGALDGGWAWQIGASHCHEFYQNPLAAYALLYDKDINAGMKAQGATEDYKTSLQTQMELYMWLMSKDGPIAGGCTNSWAGRYEQYPAGQSEFHKMAYLEHPVYADPGSNHWIGNQVWAVQRLAEMYYVVKTGKGPKSDVNIGGMDLEQCLEKLLDRWVGWFLDNSILGTANATKTFKAKYEPYDTEESEFKVPDLAQGVTDDGASFSIPASLIWSGQPESWSGKYTENNNLTCTIVGYGDGDIGCIASLANTLFYYAKARGITGADLEKGESSYKANQGTKGSEADYPAQALYLGKQLMDRMWNKARDDRGLSIADHNTNLPRLWNTKLVLPNGSRANGQGQTLSADRYTGTMPNGDTIKDGVAFYDIRTNYASSDMYKKAKAEFDSTGNTEGYYFKLHRFWHEGDAMMALGTLFELYPELTPDGGVTPSDDLKLDKDSVSVKVGDTDTIKPNKDGCTFESADPSIATVSPDGTVTGVAEGSTTITVTDADGNKATVAVTVTEEKQDFDDLIGDCNLDGAVSMADIVYLNKYLVGIIQFNDQQKRNAQCHTDTEIGFNDATALLRFLAQQIDNLPISD